MHHAALALAWEIWARHRGMDAGACVYLLLVCLCGLAFPLVPDVIGWMTIPFWMTIPLLAAAAAAYGFEARLEAASSGLPPRLLVLPVPARTLALVSFLSATVPI